MIFGSAHWAKVLVFLGFKTLKKSHKNYLIVGRKATMPQQKLSTPAWPLVILMLTIHRIPNVNIKLQ